MKRDDAVSPVIGVILMVAITVILAAVIAAFVFGMAGGISKTKTVAATARQNGNDIIVTWQGGQDNGYVVGYGVTMNDNSGSLCPVAGDCVFVNYGNAVGNSTKFGGKGDTTNNHVVVNASFTDGSGQVVLDTYV
ncbi:MAG TPA: type IV pilin N-terminal domain-containing protein [Methanomicrobiales archaeon]|nr:type IV pilin N-terminal domain-containing protein [Methanomicrobiales archaeon]